jgi:hypothetical protein
MPSRGRGDRGSRLPSGRGSPVAAEYGGRSTRPTRDPDRPIRDPRGHPRWGGDRERPQPTHAAASASPVLLPPWRPRCVSGTDWAIGTISREPASSHACSRLLDAMHRWRPRPSTGDGLEPPGRPLPSSRTDPVRARWKSEPSWSGVIASPCFLPRRARGARVCDRPRPLLRSLFYGGAPERRPAGQRLTVRPIAARSERTRTSRRWRAMTQRAGQAAG